MRNLELKNGLYPPKKVAYLYLNFDCNLDCKFCASDPTYLNLPHEINNLQVIDENLRNLSYDYSELLISGGEPTVHPMFFQVLNLARKYFHAVNLQTNGQLLAKKFFSERLLDSGIDNISIPIYHLYAENYDALVGKTGAYENLLLAFHNLNSLRNRYSTYINIKLLNMRPNYQINYRIVQLIEKIYPNPNRIQFSALRISQKVLRNKDSLVLNIRDAKPFTTKTIMEMLKYNFSLEHIPLCAVEKDLGKLLAEKYNPYPQMINSTVICPDKDVENYSVKEFIGNECNKCKVNNICQKLPLKNSKVCNYEDQLEAYI